MRFARFMVRALVVGIGLWSAGAAAYAGAGEADGEPGLAGKQSPAAVHPFNGRNLDGWKFDDIARENHWTVGRAKPDPEELAQLRVAEGGGDLVNPAGKTRNIYTERTFGDARIELEVMLPERSNSGVYVMGRYELQILDDPPVGRADAMDHGAIARVAAPAPFVPIEPGEWQRIAIDYRAPRFSEEGEKTANAVFVRVAIDGKVVHENVEVEQSGYGALTMEEAPRGPLYLQGNEGPVAYRNIKVIPRDQAAAGQGAPRREDRRSHPGAKTHRPDRTPAPPPFVDQEPAQRGQRGRADPRPSGPSTPPCRESEDHRQGQRWNSEPQTQGSPFRIDVASHGRW